MDIPIPEVRRECLTYLKKSKRCIERQQIDELPQSGFANLQQRSHSSQHHRELFQRFLKFIQSSEAHPTSPQPRVSALGAEHQARCPSTHELHQDQHCLNVHRKG